MSILRCCSFPSHLQAELLAVIQGLNQDPNVNGILVQVRWSMIDAWIQFNPGMCCADAKRVLVLALCVYIARTMTCLATRRLFSYHCPNISTLTSSWRP